MIAVTGASGYVGGRLVAHLRDTGASVEEVHRPFDPDAFAAASAVVHLAAPNEVVAAADPDQAVCETTALTRRVSAAAAAGRVGRLVYLSTVHVYGAAMVSGAVLDEQVVPEPRSPYAVARLASEHLAAASGVDTVVLRLTNSVGAPARPEVDRWSLVANDLARQAVDDGRLVLRTHGMQWRDFVALDDVCRIVAAACDPGLPAGTYNLGSGVPCTVRELAVMVQDATERLTGTRPRLDAPDPPPEPPAAYKVDVTRLANAGLAARRPVAEAVAETVGFCLDHRGRAGPVDR